MKDLTGSRKGRLLVIKRGDSDGKNRKYKVRCDCGKELWTTDASLRNNANSCGCIRKERMTKHGDYGKPLYVCWRNMLSRCYNKNNKSYKDYGGRGIKVYKSWIKDYEKFKEYISNNLGPLKSNKELDRINNAKGYKPGNLRWATKQVNSNNKRNNKRYNYKGKYRTSSEIYSLLNCDVSKENFRNRLRLGWSIKSAATVRVR